MDVGLEMYDDDDDVDASMVDIVIVVERAHSLLLWMVVPTGGGADAVNGCRNSGTLEVWLVLYRCTSSSTSSIPESSSVELATEELIPNGMTLLLFLM